MCVLCVLLCVCACACAFRPVGLYLSLVSQTSAHWAYWHPSNHSCMKTYFGGERERERWERGMETVGGMGTGREITG